MARRGGLIGEGGILRRAVEAVAQVREAEVMPAVEATQLRAAGQQNRMLRRELRDLGFAAYRFAAQQPQDMLSEERISLAAQSRVVAVSDSAFKRSIALRIAFCFGRGMQKPKAPDPQVQDVIDTFWDDLDNQACLLSPQAQWRKGWELWTQSSVFWQMFDDGLDGLVKLGSVHHDIVKDAVWDGGGTGQRVLYYVGIEGVGGGWSYQQHRAIPPNAVRTVYFEALDASLARDGEQPANPAPPAMVKPGRMVHLTINRHEGQAFGVPDGQATIRWAGAMNDLLGAQVERAKAAASYLSQVTVKGSQRQLMDQASRAATARSPLGQTADTPDAPPAGPRPGSQFWANEGVRMEPLALDAQSDSAAKDISSARDAFSAGTNFGSHYYGGDPGSLAGSVALELPADKLSQMDQELWEGLIRQLVNHAIARAVEVGLIDKRREPTPEEVVKGDAIVDDDGLVERDLTYEFSMPRAVERDLPGVIAMCADAMVAADPNGERPDVTRWFVARMLADAFGVDDPAALVDEWYPPEEPDDAPGNPGAPGTRPDEPGDPASGSGPVGPDGRRHADPDNPLGAQRDSPSVEGTAAAIERVWHAHEHGAQADLDRLFGSLGR